MKAVVLAAGKGSRLGDTTQSVPKPMLPIAGKPVLEQNISWLLHAGITDLYLNLHHLPEVIRKHFGDGQDFGVSIHYSYEEHLLGTAGAVRKIAQEYWSEDDKDDVMIVYGDNLCKFDLPALLAQHNNHTSGLATIATHYREDVSKSGVVETDDSCRISRFIEKPSPGQTDSHQVNAGIYLLRKPVLDYLQVTACTDFAYHVFPDLLAKGMLLYAHEIDGKLIPIDTPDLLRKAQVNR